MLNWNRMMIRPGSTSLDTPPQLYGELFIQSSSPASSCLHFINNNFNQAVISQFPNFFSSFFSLNNGDIYNPLSMAHWFLCPSLFVNRPLFSLPSFYFFFNIEKLCSLTQPTCFPFPLSVSITESCVSWILVFIFVRLLYVHISYKFHGKH